ncbi:hypothetical protein HC766_02990 [Candidatus Gracilibacteria bacterium]|nr:hypothetical protein [Thermales bacterium]NJL97147.1 hypothetical protein [Candidatus Gracilibacteria bacterium]NJS41322.1 hypothetical protein [Candidatus Gracilibacteria bacterium]
MNAKNIIGLLIALLLILGIVWYVADNKEDKDMKETTKTEQVDVETDGGSDTDSDETNVTLKITEE